MQHKRPQRNRNGTGMEHQCEPTHRHEVPSCFHCYRLLLLFCFILSDIYVYNIWSFGQHFATDPFHNTTATKTTGPFQVNAHRVKINPWNSNTNTRHAKFINIRRHTDRKLNLLRGQLEWLQGDATIQGRLHLVTDLLHETTATKTTWPSQVWAPRGKILCERHPSLPVTIDKAMAPGKQEIKGGTRCWVVRCDILLASYNVLGQIVA